VATSIHNLDLSAAFKAMEQIATRIVYIHVGTISARWKSAYIDYSRRLQMALIDRW